MNATGIDLSDPVTPIDHMRGATHPPITIVEYGDFECPHGRAAERSRLRTTPAFSVNGMICEVSSGLKELSDRVESLLS